MLYVAQGCWADLSTEQEVQQWARHNTLLLYKCGLLPVLIDILQLEIESVMMQLQNRLELRQQCAFLH